MEIVVFSKGNPVTILYSDEDHGIVSKHSWSICRAGYPRTKINNRVVSMHRVILGLSKGDGVVIDHINRVKTDNRRENLRRCTQQENSRNKAPSKSGTSKYMGVCIKYTKGRNKVYRYIIATIAAQNKKVFLGAFETEEAAAMAYNEAAKKHFGEFANLNVIPQTL